MRRLLYLPILGVLPFSTAHSMENFPTAVARFLNGQGPVILGKFIHATFPKNQFVVHYCVDEGKKGGKNEGANNASFVHCSIALFNKNAKGQWSYGDQVDIGQGEVKTFNDGIVFGEVVTYATGDANCCPSNKTEIRFSTLGGRLDSSTE